MALRTDSLLLNLFRSIRTYSTQKTSCGYKYNIVQPYPVSPQLTVGKEVEKPEYWKSGIPSPGPKECKFGFLLSCQAGITTDDINIFVHRQCINHGAYPSPLNYHHFPKSICTSVNNVVCHGIPDSRPLQNGEILNVDVTVYLNGVHGDCSAMFFVGEVDPDAIKLCNATKEALEAGISACKPGQPFSVIGKVIEQTAREKGYAIVPAFIGHGIGSYFHGPPDVYHFDVSGTPRDEGLIMKPGMTFTIEPALSEGGIEVTILEDEWTAVTNDGSRTAQWEHTVLITEQGVEILT
ncbi:methionine aminopeptidase 1D, mitochondrial isoform X2 [Halyomorpha halys]|uniref:methionine aminopeptidase 1D, mitochondrial isoform X2 n=1 Tax=Halyomorpha halys TaxID=286706 RepID=UPI0006D4D4E4|nr:methionine aminopeptidase 1D, mitochondrial isoform X2 [Halyomorpha halys]